MPQFPEGWPKNCPPWNAEDAQGFVYRIVRHDPCEACDFLTYAQLDLAKKAPPCRRHGLSVYRNFDDARRWRALKPEIGSKVAMGYLEARHGRMLRTPRDGDSHTTWWMYEGVDCAAIFSIINEE